jgi:hypothetical protein
MEHLNMRGLTLGLIKSGLIKGTNKSYTTSVTTNGMIGGKYVTVLTAQTNQAVPTTDASTGAAFVAQTDNTACVYVVGQNAAGSIAACQGSIVDTEVGITTTAGAFKVPPQFPTLPEDFMVLGYCLVRTAPSASNWTFGTDNWAATGVTTSEFVQCGVLPDRPVTS